MPSKKHKPEEIIGKLREAEIVLAQGASAAAACRRIAVSEQTYYRWRKEYGRLKAAVHRSCPATAVGVRAANMPGARATSIDAAQSTVWG